MNRWATAYFETKRASLADWEAFSRANPHWDGKSVNFTRTPPSMNEVLKTHWTPPPVKPGPALPTPEALIKDFNANFRFPKPHVPAPVNASIAHAATVSVPPTVLRNLR